jgi:hypothetical protein
MSYRIAGVDVHKKMLAVAVADFEIDRDFHFERQKMLDADRPPSTGGLADRARRPTMKRWSISPKSPAWASTPRSRSAERLAQGKRTRGTPRNDALASNPSKQPISSKRKYPSGGNPIRSHPRRIARTDHRQIRRSHAGRQLIQSRVKRMGGTPRRR